MVTSLKQKAISGMLWNALERFGTSLFLFISNLILARLLSPSDFGCIGILLVFVSLSDAIVDGGFGSALIQKKNPTNKDYSTIFIWNILLSTILYVILYISSKPIALFYEIDILADILKVQGLILIINALSLIQKNILIKQILFKKLANINLITIVLGTAAGIVAAYSGFGVWSLVIKSLSTGILQCILYWVLNKWKPQLIFSWTSFKELFKFGGFMFLTVFFNTLYHNILSLIIGKSFSVATLGYFTQAKKLEELPRSTISSVVSNVSFPVFSEMQDDKERLRKAADKCLQSVMFINIPVMILMIVVAKPLIVLLFTEKWIQSIPYFQALCVYGIFVTPNDLNREITKAIGKSKTTFLILIIQRTIGMVFILCGLYWGMTGLLVGYVISQIVCYVIATVVSGRLIGYGFYQQFKSFTPILCVALLAAVSSYLLIYLPYDLDTIPMISIQIAAFGTIYITLTLLFKIQGAEPFITFIKSKLKKKLL